MQESKRRTKVVVLIGASERPRASERKKKRKRKKTLDLDLDRPLAGISHFQSVSFFPEKEKALSPLLVSSSSSRFLSVNLFVRSRASERVRE